MQKIYILIVDDDDFVCQNIKLKFKRLQYTHEFELFTANSVKQALGLVDQQTFDIIFTDINMPYISGLSFIETLRTNNYSGKIFVLSGYDDFDFVRTAFINGADDYLLKPLALSQLEEKLTIYFEAATPTKPLQVPVETIPTIPSSPIDCALSYIETHYKNENLSMADVAQHVSLSYSHFSALFRKTLHTTFPNYLLQFRIQKAIELLGDPTLRVSDICYMIGFKYPQQFSRDFKKVTGYYPSEHPKKFFSNKA